MLTPEADIHVDAALVASLIEAQHPDLAGPLALVADGWDNVIYRLGGDLAVRIPRRQVAVQLIVNEQTWLPRLAPRLPVAVPVPVRVGMPSSDFPWPWSIVRWVDGIDGADVSGAERSPIAGPLAEFVAALHIPAPAGQDVPHNPVRGVPLATRDRAVRERLEHLAERHDVAPLIATWERALATPPWSGPAIWLHGDLHPGNLMLTAESPRQLAAVIDFGDLTAGDPATDLATAWLTFEPDARAVFRERLQQLSPVNDDTWLRAHGWAVAMGSALAAHSDDNPRMASLGRHALGQLSLPA
ncbi:aminoglycoside phosphotransferase family protein [Leifsonia sp. NPDC058248]|uniref:aminoglycoside phosphotransferase family protein n=1 Tax=Leifsonia sp. NPDC058248 TaxID=3346402 RepID=UPI0036DD77CC